MQLNGSLGHFYPRGLISRLQVFSLFFGTYNFNSLFSGFTSINGLATNVDIKSLGFVGLSSIGIMDHKCLGWEMLE